MWTRYEIEAAALTRGRLNRRRPRSVDCKESRMNGKICLIGRNHFGELAFSGDLP